MSLRPTLPAVLVALAGLPLAVLPAIVDSRLWPLWVGGVAAGAAAIGLDVLGGVRRKDLRVRVHVPKTIQIGEEEPFRVRLSAGGRESALAGHVLAELSDLFVPPELVPFAAPAGHDAAVETPLRPVRRGTGEVRAVWIRLRGPLRLTERILRVPLDRKVAVIPNIRAVRAAAIRHFRRKEFLGGQKSTRLAGDGSSFESLREFLPGHDHRAIHWKASARHVKLLVREFREERDNQIVLAFDTGHVMAEPSEGIPRLDHAINAGLLLAFAALKTGDRVGLFGFDDEVRLFAPPRGGVGAFAGVQRLLAGLSASAGETNFTLGLTDLLGRLSRRSLVVVFTDLMDSVMVELMVANMGRLAGRHLVLCITLRDPELLAQAAAPPDSTEALNRAVVAGDLLRDRDLAVRRLARLGVHCIDAAPGEVSTRLIDHYLLVKRKELV